MFELKKGDAENLRGVGLTYACCFDWKEAKSTPYPAMAFGSDPLEFYELAIGKFDASAHEILDYFSKNVRHERMCLAAPLSFDNEMEILGKDADIIYCGRVPRQFVVPIFMVTITDYGTKYLSQQHRKAGINIDLKEIVREDHKLYSARHLREKLYALSGKLFDAVASHGSKDVETASKSIVALFSGTELEKQALDIVGVITGSHKKRIKLSEYAIEKLLAIRDERYEDATKHRDMIAALKQQI